MGEGLGVEREGRWAGDGGKGGRGSGGPRQLLVDGRHEVVELGALGDAAVVVGDDGGRGGLARAGLLLGVGARSARLGQPSLLHRHLLRQRVDLPPEERGAGGRARVEGLAELLRRRHDLRAARRRRRRREIV